MNRMAFLVPLQKVDQDNSQSVNQAHSRYFLTPLYPHLLLSLDSEKYPSLVLTTLPLSLSLQLQKPWIYHLLRDLARRCYLNSKIHPIKYHGGSKIVNYYQNHSVVMLVLRLIHSQ